MSGLDGRSVLVVGLGISGAAAARAARRAGARVTVVDAADTPALRQRAADLDAGGVQVILGTGASVDPAAFDLVVPSPGVPEHHALLSAALATGISVWSEPELAWQLNGGRTRVVGVTGTNGKTTTTELLSACLGAPAAGNIGNPLSDILTSAEPPAMVVAELSSFQLRFTQELRPWVAVLLNVAPDHLDWHGSFDAYGAAKARIWAQQRAEDWAVTNDDDHGARGVVLAHPPPSRHVTFTTSVPREGQVGTEGNVIRARLCRTGERLVPLADLPITGRHDLENTLAATAAAFCAGADATAIRAALQRYTRGPHRLEHVATLGGVRYVNDSKATNPHAAAAALVATQAMPADEGTGSIVWILGGLNKGLDLAPLASVARGRVRAAMTIGTSGPELAALLGAAGIEVVEAGELGAAVTQAAHVARPGDTVLLAPACASMDQFTDYRQRGSAFRSVVSALAAGEVT